MKLYIIHIQPLQQGSVHTRAMSGLQLFSQCFYGSLLSCAFRFGFFTHNKSLLPCFTICPEGEIVA